MRWRWCTEGRVKGGTGRRKRIKAVKEVKELRGLAIGEGSIARGVGSSLVGFSAVVFDGGWGGIGVCGFGGFGFEESGDVFAGAPLFVEDQGVGDDGDGGGGGEGGGRFDL